MELVDLGPAGPIDTLIADFRADLLGDAECRSLRNLTKAAAPPPAALPDQPGSSLRAAIFDALIPHLSGQKSLLVAPDGDLCRLPLEVLPRGDRGRLIDDFRISYLSCGRDLLRLGTATTGRADSPMVMADPDFDLGTADVSPSTAAASGRTRGRLWSWLSGRAHPSASAGLTGRRR